MTVRRLGLLVKSTTRDDGGATASTFTVPDLLSGDRLALTPVLFALAWQGRATAFLLCLSAALFSDALDGWLARRLVGGSNLGTKLDSWADIALCLSVPLGVWLLWPDLVRREAAFVGAVVACYAVPALFALLKYRRLPSYHTWTAKLGGVLMGTGGFLLLAGGPAWAFHLATLAVVIEAIEEVAITAILPQRRSNIPSFWHALPIARQSRAAS
jgi:phosphatidylglycerophosphate synthase